MATDATDPAPVLSWAEMTQWLQEIGWTGWKEDEDDAASDGQLTARQAVRIAASHEALRAEVERLREGLLEIGRNAGDSSYIDIYCHIAGLLNMDLTDFEALAKEPSK